MKYNEAQLIKMYLDWVNNFLTTNTFAEHYSLSLAEAENVLDSGRKLFNINNDLKGKDMVKVRGCVWGEEQPRVTTTKRYYVASSKGYSNSRHNETFDNKEEAIEAYSKLRRKEDGYDATWNEQDEVITLVTTTTEIVHIIKAEDKK